MPTPPRFGLRTTIKLFDTVVEQHVSWANPTDWTAVNANVPNETNAPIGRYRWNGAVVEIQGLDTNRKTIGGAADCWTWRNNNGVEVSLDRIKMQRARRGTGEAWGDVALLVMMLTLMVGIAQLNTIFRMVVGEPVQSVRSLEPSPELIARYLRQEFGGAATGQVAYVDRNQQFREKPLVYLPAGSPGPLDRAGGGTHVSDTLSRRAPTNEATPDQNRTRTPDANKPEIAPRPGQQPLMVAADEPPIDDKITPRASIERFVGWGFHDWLDVAESTPAADREMVERLRLAQEIMRIDPNDPFALLTVSYYAYLSENHQLCRDLYKRYIELYPDDAAGWNNLALSYKRTGEYDEEEKLYRIALSLEPGNTNTKNNLAVNLAHQGRYGEARDLMGQLNSAPEEVPYAELHRAKIAASEGKNRQAYRHLKKALSLVERLDTFHHIEFRQDIRLDPSFDALRAQSKFRQILRDRYGDDTPLALGQGVRPQKEVSGG